MNHVGSIEIETERLLLRKFIENDVRAELNKSNVMPHCEVICLLEK